MLTVDLNAKVRLKGTWTDPLNNNAPIDPSNVTIMTLDPSGLQTIYTYPATVTKDSTGVYHTDIVANMVGDWQVWYYSTGTAQGSKVSAFSVSRNKFV